MGVATDKTIKDLRNAVNGIDTSNLLSDSTGVAIKNAILAIANAITTNNSLVGLNDVVITSPLNGQALVYDSISQKWVNGNAGGSSGIINYSTTEQNTGIKWIDNSDVYQKTIIINNVSISSGGTETIDTISDLDTIIKCNGFVVEGNLKYTLNDISLRVIQNGLNVNLYSPLNTTWSISTGAIIIDYLKSS